MTGMEVFYFVVLPLAIAGGGWLAVMLHERSGRDSRLRPGE